MKNNKSEFVKRRERVRKVFLIFLLYAFMCFLWLVAKFVDFIIYS